jgi:DNA processing protein
MTETATPPAAMDDGERACWVAFNRTPGIAGKRIRLLLGRFGSLAGAWKAPAKELALAGLDARTIGRLEAVRSRLEPERELERVRRAGAWVLTWRDAEYPQRLAAIPDPPPVLYVRGRLSDADAWALAIVGTRRPTLYGRGVAERLAAELAGAGVTIVSGLAKGIDSHAHRGALAGGGRTLAVLGNGIDLCYPPENRRLAAEIAEHGALVTEYGLGVGPAGENFPPRNRIISGLAAGVLVVEAGETSGALITCRFAAEQGRDVFAVPGPITSPASRGCHRLIQDGAALVTSADDVLQELNPHIGLVSARQLRLDLADEGAWSEASTGPWPDPVPGADGTLLQYLREAGQPVHIDDLARACGRPVQEVSAMLVLLEIQGQVRHAGGMRYTATG